MWGVELPVAEGLRGWIVVYVSVAMTVVVWTSGGWGGLGNGDRFV